MRHAGRHQPYGLAGQPIVKLIHKSRTNRCRDVPRCRAPRQWVVDKKSIGHDDRHDRGRVRQPVEEVSQMTWRHAQADKGNVGPSLLKHPADVGQVPGLAVPAAGARVHVGQARGQVRQFVGLRTHSRHQRDLVPGRHQHLAELGREVAGAVAGLNLVETDGDVHSVVFCDRPPPATPTLLPGGHSSASARGLGRSVPAG